jgi:hypothetical protein
MANPGKKEQLAHEPRTKANKVKNTTQKRKEISKTDTTRKTEVIPGARE